ncbi:MAG: alpha-L-rhamnosidase C-terminal domain-containing protein [Janthinobacterium lividum]
MFGDVSNWFIQWVAGIGLDPNSPGFQHVIIQPQPVGNLTWAKARHDSPHGPITCGWQRDGTHFHLNVTIPANATATVRLPASDSKRVSENGLSVDRSPGVRFLSQEKDHSLFEVGSGSYAFTSIIS